MLASEPELSGSSEPSEPSDGLCIVEVGRIHDQNRVLIRQELAFLDHLMRVLSGTPQAGYSATGWLSTPQAATVLDAKA